MTDNTVTEAPPKEAQGVPERPSWDLPEVEPRRAGTGLLSGEGWLLYGPPKVGKSTFAASFPKPLILDLERGYQRIECAQPLQPKNLQEFRECFAMIRQRVRDDKFPFETIVIDSADKLNAWNEVEACRELGIKEMGLGEFGSDWAAGRKKWFSVIDAFRDLGKTLVVIGHSKLAVTDNTMKAKTTDLPGKLARMFSATMDYIGYCHGIKGEKGTIDRVVTFEPYEGLDAGCRNHALVGQVLPMDYAAIEARVKEWNAKEAESG